jgi:hypothetical protein
MAIVQGRIGLHLSLNSNVNLQHQKQQTVLCSYSAICIVYYELNTEELSFEDLLSTDLLTYRHLLTEMLLQRFIGLQQFRPIFTC